MAIVVYRMLSFPTYETVLFLLKSFGAYLQDEGVMIIGALLLIGITILILYKLFKYVACAAYYSVLGLFIGTVAMIPVFLYIYCKIPSEFANTPFDVKSRLVYAEMQEFTRLVWQLMTKPINVG